ncbi:MAG: apolipoprotein N-acyltransferase [Mangrovicoccus sp.]|nr:apolipoprotein N-acyltransferase [Mangrovicoccus sp.]
MTAPKAIAAPKQRFWYGAVLGLGVLAALGHAPFSLPILTIAGLAGVFWLLTTRFSNPASAGRAGLVFGMGYFAVTLHWITQPFLVDVARHGWMAPFGLIGLAGGMALFWGGGIWFAAWLAGRAGLLAAVLGLALAEMIRSGLFGGFPWGLIGSVWVDSPARAAAAWGGVHGLSLLSLGAAAGIAALVLRHRVWALLGLGCAMALGTAPMLAPEPSSGGDQIKARLVQANAAQHLKWLPEMIPVFWQRRLQFTAAAADPPPDAVIWPEVSLPYLLGRDPEGDRIIAQAAGGAPVLLGAQRRGADGALYNSLAVIAPDGEIAAVYDKHHLVPFGEYFPGGAMMERLGLAGLATDALGAFSPGPGPQVLDLSAYGLGLVAPLICYEAIFPRYGGAAQPRPDWFVQLTNDAWFGNFAGPQQHLDLARLRATEQGVPVLRAANTGISAVIGPDGTVLGEIGLNIAGYLDQALPAALPPTLYARLGNAPVWVVIALLSLFAVLCRLRARSA